MRERQPLAASVRRRLAAERRLALRRRLLGVMAAEFGRVEGRRAWGRRAKVVGELLDCGASVFEVQDAIPEIRRMFGFGGPITEMCVIRHFGRALFEIEQRKRRLVSIRSVFEMAGRVPA